MVGSRQTVLQCSSTALVIIYRISTRINISLKPGRGASEEGSGFQGDSARSLLLSRHRLVMVKHPSADGTHTHPTAQCGCCAPQHRAPDRHLCPQGTSHKIGQNCTELCCPNAGPVLLNTNKPIFRLVMQGKGA